MLKNCKRYVSWLLLAAMLFSAAGCQMITERLGSGTTSQPAEAADAPTLEAQLTQSPTQEPTATPELPAGERFDALDKRFFTDYVTEDGYTFHQMITDPAKYGVDPASVEMTLGDFSEEAFKENAALYQTYLDELNTIQREELTARQQLGYDILQQGLETSILDTGFEYYYEPLSKLSGAQSNLPLSMALYEIETVDDVENYLALLADFPRYMNQIMEYEREMSVRGRFMTENALDDVLSACQEIIDSRDTLFLIATFNDQLDQIQDLTAQQAETYKAQNQQLVTGPFVDSFVALAAGLEELRSTCHAFESMYASDDEGLAYFEQRLKDEASADITPDEALALLNQEIANMIIEISLIAMAHPEALESSPGEMTTGDTQSDLSFLKSLAEELIGPLPEHELEVLAYPEELESSMSAASYVIPSLDGWKQNQIYINGAKIGETETFLSTLAHETYPGHLYQHVYQRAIEDLPLSQRIIHFGGYAEGWSQTAERIMTLGQDRFDQNYYLMTFYNSMVINVLLPAATSIYVNYKGNDMDEVKEYLSSYFNDQAAVDTLADAYYDWAVDAPFYTFSYALGYAQITDMLRSAQADLGDGFDQKAYLNYYLSLGPGYYNILREQMDVWVDAQMPN